MQDVIDECFIGTTEDEEGEKVVVEGWCVLKSDHVVVVVVRLLNQRGEAKWEHLNLENEL